MRINYCGQIEGSKFNTRVAEIDFNKKEESIVRKIADITEKETGWKKWSFFDDSVTISVDDKEDYNDFKDFYLETKRMLKTEAKKEG